MRSYLDLSQLKVLYRLVVYHHVPGVIDVLSGVKQSIFKKLDTLILKHRDFQERHSEAKSFYGGVELRLPTHIKDEFMAIVHLSLLLIFCAVQVFVDSVLASLNRFNSVWRDNI